MDLLFIHKQTKEHKKVQSTSKCEIKLCYDEINLNLMCLFEFDYNSYGTKKHITFEHGLAIDTIGGDITVIYRIINDGLVDDNLFKSSLRVRKNDFSLLKILTIFGFERGEKRIGFWGVKYKRSIDTIFNKIHEIFKSKFKSKFFIEHHNLIDLNQKNKVNRLYDLVVNFHLDCKNIKGHDNIYEDIQNIYPSKKWLLKNDNKFLPAVLDSYGIKTKYLISEINSSNISINLNSLNYLCKLFGDNFIDYIKQIPWKIHCFENPPNKKTYTLKNESEKKCMVKLINTWEDGDIRVDTLIYSLSKMFTIREFLEKKDLKLKFNAKTTNQFDNLLENWLGIKLHLNRGFKMKYTLPLFFLNEIEEEIKINDDVFTPKVLLTEDDFRLEGLMMKNCMSKQFMHGSLYIYVSLRNKRKRVNLQYRKGVLSQSLGRANSTVSEFFNESIKILNQRLIKHQDITWKKDKYDFLS